MDDTGTGYGELRAADVVRLVVWVLGVGGLVVYSLITPNRSAGLAYGVAIVVGIAFGLPRSRWPAVQVFAPLLLFGVGGFLASSHFSNTRGYDGGDWSGRRSSFWPRSSRVSQRSSSPVRQCSRATPCATPGGASSRGRAPNVGQAARRWRGVLPES